MRLHLSGDYTLTDHRRYISTAGTASTVVIRRGMGPLAWLGIIFVLLKLFGLTAVAGWSWWLVLLPFYIGIAIVLGIWAIILAVVAVVMLCVGLVGGIGYLMDAWKYRRRPKPSYRR